MYKRSILIVVLVLISWQVCQAGSIWAKRNQTSAGVWADDTARSIGDVLTININEISDIDNETTRDLSKTTRRDQNFDGELGVGEHTGILPSINFGTGDTYSNTLNGSAEYEDERSFIDSITVTVVDVLENGNLVVLGSRNRDIAGDKQIIQVSGIVRPSDIAYDNSVSSELVANFHVVVENKGISKPYNEPGWLGRILDVLWPF